jgi:hypothetical protein
VDNGLCVGYFWTHVEPEKFIVLGELVAWVSQFWLFGDSLLTLNGSSFSGMMKLIAVL